MMRLFTSAINLKSMSIYYSGLFWKKSRDEDAAAYLFSHVCPS